VQAAHGGRWGHAWPTVTRTRGQDSWLHPEPRGTAWGGPTTAGRDELAPRWRFVSPARSRHQPRQREMQRVSWRELSDKPLFPQEQANSVQHNQVLLLLLQPRRPSPGARLCHAQPLHRAVPSAGHGLQHVRLQWHFEGGNTREKRGLPRSLHSSVWTWGEMGAGGHCCPPWPLPGPAASPAEERAGRRSHHTSSHRPALEPCSHRCSHQRSPDAPRKRAAAPALPGTPASKGGPHSPQPRRRGPGPAESAGAKGSPILQPPSPWAALSGGVGTHRAPPNPQPLSRVSYDPMRGHAASTGPKPGIYGCRARGQEESGDTGACLPLPTSKGAETPGTAPVEEMMTFEMFGAPHKRIVFRRKIHPWPCCPWSSTAGWTKRLCWRDHT